MLQLHKEIIDFVEFVSPTPEEQASRTAAVQSVSEVIKYIWPHCIMEVFGSFRTGLYLPTSDIDVQSAFQMAYSSLTDAKAILGFGHHRGILRTIIRPDPVLLDRRGGSNGELTFDQLLPGAGEPVMPQIVKGRDLVCNWQLVDDDEPLPREKIVPEDNHVSSWCRRLLKVKKDITSDRYEENGVVKESSVKKKKRKGFRDEDGFDNGRYPRYMSRSCRSILCSTSK